MKLKLSWAASLLLSASVLLLCSCSNDDDDKPSKPTVQITELGSGHDSPNDKIAYAGTDAHIEAKITAEGSIKEIEVEAHQVDGNYKFNKVYTESKYVGVKNTTFHEHLVIPADAPAGAYHLHLIVKDGYNQTGMAESELTIKASNVNITIADLTFGAGHSFPNNKIAYQGTAPHIEASKITAGDGIKKIEVFMHNEDPAVNYELKFEFAYNGEKEIKDFHKHISIPADAPVGEYHTHFKVTDMKDKSKEEAFDVNIKATGMSITGLEIGDKNTAKASNIHAEFKVTDDTALRSVRVRIYTEAAPTTILWEQSYTENFATEEVKSYTFHKHLNASDKVAVGKYILEIRVNDKKDAYIILKESLTILPN